MTSIPFGNEPANTKNIRRRQFFGLILFDKRPSLRLDRLTSDVGRASLDGALLLCEADPVHLHPYGLDASVVSSASKVQTTNSESDPSAKKPTTRHMNVKLTQSNQRFGSKFWNRAELLLDESAEPSSIEERRGEIHSVPTVFDYGLSACLDRLSYLSRRSSADGTLLELDGTGVDLHLHCLGSTVVALGTHMPDYELPVGLIPPRRRRLPHSVEPIGSLENGFKILDQGGNLFSESLQFLPERLTHQWTGFTNSNVEPKLDLTPFVSIGDRRVEQLVAVFDWTPILRPEPDHRRWDLSWGSSGWRLASCSRIHAPKSRITAS